MKKHKNLSKQELMTRQDIPCVQLGGKFVSLKSKTEARQGGSRKKQAEQLLATVVMGMNLVNTAAPLAVLATAEQKLSAVPQPVRSEAEPLDYAMLPQLADVVDRAIFARTEAADYDGNASVTDMVDGDSQTITAGQSGTVSTMSGGKQNISSGGTGTISTMSGGGLTISSGGNGTVSTMSAGWQEIYDGGTGTVSTMLAKYGYQGINGGTGTVNVMSSGAQYVNGGTGTVSTMSGGKQNISSGGTGTISTMEGGSQTISSGGNGTVVTMTSGWQNIDYGGTGTVSTMNSGQQTVKSGGAGTVSTMLGGAQLVESGGTGAVSIMNDGEQNIYSGGSGTVVTMNSGGQYITSGTGTVSTMSGGMQDISSGTGTISTMLGGAQLVESGGSGIVSTLSGGTQIIVEQGSGTVSAMNGGTQMISSGGIGTVSTVSGGMQEIVSGTGMISTMNSGMQNIRAGGTGTVSTLSGGSQSIAGGGTGTVDIMSGGMQDISSGGTGTVNTMSGGGQRISSGIGTVSTMSGGVQLIYSGAAGTVSTMNGGVQYVQNGGTALDTVIAGGTQIVSSGGTSLDTLLNSGGTVYQKSGGMISSMVYSGGVQIIENITTGYDGMTLGSGGTNVTMGVISGAQMSGTIINSGGEQLVLNGGTALDTELNGGSLQLSSGGTVKDMTLTSGSLELENINGGSFTVSGTLTANNATVDMTDSSIKRAVPTVAYESLTIDKLSGSGTTFVMDTDLAGEANSDKITITDADAGTHYVQIKDLSKLNNIEVIGAHQQLLITDNSGKLTFEGKEFNAGGLWDIDPTLAKQGNDWYLTKIAKTANNDTRVLLDAADNSYALWRNTNDSLRSRLGALASGSEQSDGIWARTQAGRFSGDNYEGRYNLYQLGFDQAADAKSVYGAAVDYGDGSGSYDPGSGKDKLKSFSLYGVWTGANGAYTNVTARYGMVSTDLESYGDYPDKAEYKQHAYSVSVEYGKRIALDKNWFIEPNAQFTLGRLGSIDYTTDRGANGYIEGMNSAIGRIGFVMGQKIRNGSDIYLKADLLHEFAGERDLQLTSDAGGTNDMLTKHNDYGDTWFELGLGANIKVSKAASIYGEIERGFGGDINKKWSVNGGVRFTF